MPSFGSAFAFQRCIFATTDRIATSARSDATHRTLAPPLKTLRHSRANTNTDTRSSRETRKPQARSVALTRTAHRVRREPTSDEERAMSWLSKRICASGCARSKRSSRAQAPRPSATPLRPPSRACARNSKSRPILARQRNRSSRSSTTGRAICAWRFAAATA